MATVRTETPLLIVFTNLSRFSAECMRRTDNEIADLADHYYEQVAAGVDSAGGKVIKFIGDGALATFPEDAVDEGIDALLRLKDAIDHSMADRQWDCRFNAKVHFGTVVSGPFGADGAKRFDVIGKAVNTAAMLESTGITLSVEAFRKLGPEARARFKKHTPPVTYLRLEDPRPFRSNRRRSI